VFVRPVEQLREVHALWEQGLNDCEIARRTGIPRTTVGMWRRAGRVSAGRAGPTGRSCPRCGHPEHDVDALPAAAYAYLLGLYLGDGHVVGNRKGVFRLRVFLDARYPGIIDECQAAMEATLPGQRADVRLQRHANCVVVSMFSKQWPCLFPQHGPGRKHERAIVLAAWQQRIVEEQTGALLRGLIHSDGWRGTNRVVVRGKAYAYGRYEFSNRSEDIERIFCDACDRFGVAWRVMNRSSISVARRESVARLDEVVGHKR
jgi:hypothetical protein